MKVNQRAHNFQRLRHSSFCSLSLSKESLQRLIDRLQTFSLSSGWILGSKGGFPSPGMFPPLQLETLFFGRRAPPSCFRVTDTRRKWALRSPLDGDTLRRPRYKWDRAWQRITPRRGIAARANDVILRLRFRLDMMLPPPCFDLVSVQP
jgi:hypothetical protein